MITNPLLGGFLVDIHTQAMDTKYRLMEMTIREGEPTKQSLEWLFARTVREGPQDPSSLFGCRGSHEWVITP